MATIIQEMAQIPPKQIQSLTWPLLHVVILNNFSIGLFPPVPAVTSMVATPTLPALYIHTSKLATTQRKKYQQKKKPRRPNNKTRKPKLPNLLARNNSPIFYST